MNQSIKSNDWMLFTTTVLMMSSAAAIVREEIDQLVMAGTNHDQLDQLRRARADVAALAVIAELYEGECS